MKTQRLLFPLLILITLAFAGCGRDVPQLLPLSKDAVILAFGDSLTYGTGTKAETSYPAVLERLSGHTVINAGIPGELSAHGLERLPGELDEYHPKLLILCHGGNDMLRRKSLTEMQGNLEKMIRLAQEKGIQVVLLGVPEPAIFGLKSADVYYKTAEDTGVPIEDKILPEILADNALKSDQIHPNADGYHQLAEAVYRLLHREGALP